jgi:exosome complex RNA-binding protein Csl4
MIDSTGLTLPILMLEDEPEPSSLADVDPGVVVLTCANCGAAMDERKCKLICRCGYFLSCSDYY